MTLPLFDLYYRAPHVQTDAFLVQYFSKLCTSDTILTTIEECRSAQSIVDPQADAVTLEHTAATPKGCSQFEGSWYFNTHETGEIYSSSEPVCKYTTTTAAGTRQISMKLNNEM